MFKHFLLKESLQKLCNGNYLRSDVNVVVTHFIEITKRIILQKPNLQYLLSEWNEFGNELDDIALDYVAPLFARDENGIFIELKTYFSQDFLNNNVDVSDAINRLIHSTIKQESIRVYEDRDPIGKIFYRSLRYILTKHTEWEKTKSKGGEPIISLVGMDFPMASEDIIIINTRISEGGSAGLTKGIELGLIMTIGKMRQSVPVRFVLKAVRSQIDRDYTSVNHTADPALEMAIEIHVKNALQSIDISILGSYEEKNKLQSREREGFIQALSHVLKDFHSGNGNISYYDYLAAELPELKSQEQYMKQYRKQFEYVAKITKRTFSANVKTDFKLK